MRKKLLALIMCLCMVMTLMPSSAVAGQGSVRTTEGDDEISPLSVIVPDRPEDYVTFVFYNNGELVGTQVVKTDGGELMQPATPAVPEGSCFIGWYVGDEAMQFGIITGRYNGGETVTVEARFTDVFYVYFMTVDGSVYSTGEARADTWAVDAPDYRPQGQRVTGWFYVDENGLQTDFNPDSGRTDVRTEIGHDVRVYPRVENCYWVSFNTLGGSGVGSVSVAGSETLPLDTIPAPTRSGYSFKGWSLSEGGEIISSVSPDSDITLYAVWESALVNYTVVYWGENADDDEFGTMLGTETKTTVTGAAVSGGRTLPTSTSNRDYFTYKDSDTDVVKPDGSTVINVRFSRIRYSVSFNLGNDSKRSMTIDGKTYYGGRGAEQYVLTAKYEQNVEAKWPTAANFANARGFHGWKYPNSNLVRSSKVVNMTDDFCKAGGITMTADFGANYLDHLNYMFESFDQTSPEGDGRVKRDGVYYDRSAEYSQDVYSGGGDWGQKSITGMTPKGVTSEDGWGERSIYLFYDRMSYELVMNNYGSVRTEQLKYGAPLDGYGAAPARPEGFSENAQFLGWYTVPPEQVTETTVAYDFSGKTMPLDGLIVYAYWAETPITLTVIGLDGESRSESVAIGTVISSADVFKSAQSEDVLCWVYEDMSEVNVNEAIFADTTIRAIPFGELYTLSYNTLTGTSITDDARYGFGSKARAADGSGLERDGEVFAYWTDGKQVYYPGSYVTMTENVELTAVYIRRPVLVSLSYYANYPDAEPSSFTHGALTNNGAVALLEYSATSMPTRPGYDFIGWSQTPDGDAEHQPGDSVRLDDVGENALYAVWQARDVGYRVEFYFQNSDLSYPGEPGSVASRQGKTDSSVSVTDDDKAPKGGGRYVLDDAAENVYIGVVAADGSLTLRLYFKLGKAAYTVNYFWNGTQDNAAEPKTGAESTIGESISEQPIDIPGYTAVSSESKSLVIAPDAAQNVITFYYYKNVTLTANSAVYEYDGTEKSVSGFEGAPESADFSMISVGAAGTNAGKYPASFDEGTVGTVDGTEKYIVSAVNDGLLEISASEREVTVIISGNKSTQPYSGTVQSVRGYKVNSISDILYTTDCFNFTGRAEAEGTDADTYPMGISPADFENISPNFANVKFLVTDGSLTVTSRDIALTAGSAEKEYDGSPLTCTDYELSSGSFVEGEGLESVTTSGSRTLPGSSDNRISDYTLKSGTKAQNYNITLENGILRVKDRSELYVIDVEANSAEKLYDGEIITVEGFKTLEFTVDGNTYTVAGLAAVKRGVDAADSGEVWVSGTPTVLDAEGNDVTAQFTVNVHSGLLEIKPRSLTLTSGSGEKVYDGLPLTNDKVTVTGDGFAAGEGANYFVTGSRTDVGRSDNEFTYELTGGAKAENYSIETKFGELIVKPISTQIVITASDAEKLYDGTPLTGEQAGFSYTGTLAAGDRLEVRLTGSVTDAGETANTVSGYRVLRGDRDVTANYIFGQPQSGTLTVKPRSVTLTSATDKKVYDGTPLVNDRVTVSGDGFAPGDGAEYSVTGSQTEVGSSDNKFSYTLTGSAKPENYVIELKYGTLTVEPVTAELTIRAASAERSYNGQPLTDSGYDYTRGVLAEGDVLTAVVTGSRSDFGSSENKVTGYKIMRGETDVTEFYTNVKLESGTLRITPRVVTLESASADKPYDGTPLTRPEVAVGGEGFVDGEVEDLRATGTITEHGSVKNLIEYEKTAAFKPENYSITETVGTLTITVSESEVVVYISGRVVDDKYDGSEKTAEGYEITRISNPLYAAKDIRFTGNDSVSAANAGNYEMGISEADFENANENFSNVTFVVNDGALNIARREVTLTSETDEKEYDGTPLTRPDVTVGGDGFVEGEVENIRAAGSITNCGSVDNTIVFDALDGFRSDNYHIVRYTGTLSITKSSAAIVISAADNEWEYDGKIHSDQRFTVSFGGELLTVGSDGTVTLPTGDKLSAVISGSVRNVADSADGNNIVAYYTLENAEQYANVLTEDGTLRITPKPLEITAGSAEKQYDRHPLTCGSYTSTPLAEGDRFDSVTLTGSQTEAGSSANIASGAVIKPENGGDATANYTITYKPGTLTVTAVTDRVTVTITERGGSYKYDGAEKPAEGYDVKISGSDYLESDFHFTGDASVRGTDAGKYEMQLKAEDFENLNANFENVVFIIVDKTLEISPRSLTLTSASDEKIYDGSPLINNKVTVSGDGFAEGEGAEYVVIGSRLDVGSSPNSFDYTLNDGTKPENYVISTSVGTLTVKPVAAKIKITAASDKKMYDGTPLENPGYDYTKGVLLEGEELIAVVAGSITDAGSAANKVKSYAVMRGETDITANYIFDDPSDGALVITPRKLLITSADAEKVYDGEPLTKHEVDVTLDGFAEGEGAEYVFSGSQTNIGESDNEFEYKLMNNTKPGNYEIETEFGTLRVLRPDQHITVTALSAEKLYDGKPLTGEQAGYKYTGFVVPSTDTLIVELEGSLTDVGETVNRVKSVCVMRGDEDVTANYIFDDPVDGTLTVTPRKVTMTSGTANKVYDGKPLRCDIINISGDGFAEGEGAQYIITGSQTEIGHSDNEFTYVLRDNTKADNYIITVEFGGLYVRDGSAKPQTGDMNDVSAITALMLTSAVSASAALTLLKKRRKEER